MLTTTLNKIREHDPCSSGYKKLLTHLNKTEADDEPLALSEILKSNGLIDAVWCLHTDESFLPVAQRFALGCAKMVIHLMKDERSVKCVEITEKYLNGKATLEELKSVRVAAYTAYTANADDAAAAAIAATYAARAADADAAAYATYATETADVAATSAATYAAYTADTRAAAYTAYYDLRKKQKELFLELVS